MIQHSKFMQKTHLNTISNQ